MTDFDSYIKQGEPSQRESAEVWKTAIGLQSVDGLTPSAYLLQTAQQNIEGQITMDEARQRIDAYYQSKEGRELEANERGKEEADKVAGNIGGKVQDEGISKGNYCTLKCTLEEREILRLLSSDPKMTQKELASAIGKSERTVKTLTHRMVEKGYMVRINGRRDGYWRINVKGCEA